MLKKERAIIVQQMLKKLYPSPPIPLQHSDSYTLLIAVLLSAQCTDKRVNEITPILFKKAKTPYEMIQLLEKTIYDIIRPCGLGPRKSKSILALSHILVNKYQGNVPESLEKLEQLPGVGHKTASVVLSRAYGVSTFPVDTHIHRLANRWKLSDGKNVKKTEKDLKELFPSESWNDLHLQIIYYGREYCQARKCYGLTCPICKAIFPNRVQKVLNPKT